MVLAPVYTHSSLSNLCAAKKFFQGALMITNMIRLCLFFVQSMFNEEEYLVALGLRIKKIRTEKKMSQQKCASICNFEKSNMSRIESGKTNPTILTLRKISQALGVRVCDLIEIE